MTEDEITEWMIAVMVVIVCAVVGAALLVAVLE
jgi:hypothetical protein